MFSIPYHKIVGIIPIEKRGKLSVKLIDLILKSKNDDKMPSILAKNILHHWNKGPLLTEGSLSVVLEAAVLLEPQKTTELLEEELQLANVAKAVRQISRKI